MRFFWNLSIRWKLKLIIMLTCIVALFLACAVFVAYEVFSFRNNTESNLSTQAQIIGFNSRAALLFKDPEAAERTLAALKYESSVVSAAVYAPDGTLFAKYVRGDLRYEIVPPHMSQVYPSDSNHMSTLQPIVQDNETIGTVYVRSDLEEMHRQLQRFAWIMLLVLLLASMVALGLSDKLQRVVSAPVVALARIAREVSEKKDYSVRASSVYHDEIGKLIEAFNEMLSQIQSRDKALEHSEKHFRSLIEKATDIITILDADGRIRYESPSIERVLGYVPEELVGKSALDFIHPEDAKIVRNALAQLAEPNGATVSVEFRFRRKNGSWATIESITRNLMGESSVAGIIVNSRDITERKRAEDALQERARLAVLEADIGTGLTRGGTSAEILQLCSEAIVRHLDAAFARIWILKETDQVLELQASAGMYTHLNGSHSRVPVGSLKIGRIAAERKPHLTNQVVGDPRVADQAWAEREGMVSFAGYPLLIEDHLLGVVAMFARHPLTDVTLNALASISNNIALGFERMRAEEKLRTTATRLERSNRELQDFAYVASHDLQEPLRKIQAFGDRLKAKCAEALSEDGRDYLARMQNASGRMQLLINDLLSFSRVTTKAQPFTPVDLSKVAHEVLSDLEVRIEQTKGRVEVGELPTIDADPLQMRQLLQNLIGNALKFHRKDQPPVVKVQAHRLNGHSPATNGDAPDGERCELIVQDNGIGFEEKYTAKIFGVFQRLHGRDEYEGTGVGLAICLKIAERHGGTIKTKSALNEGATFTVSLPVKQTNKEEAS